MQTTIKPVLSIYVNNNGTLFCLVYKNRNIEKSLPIDLFYLTYEDEKTAREAAGICIFHSMMILRMARSIFAERNLVKVYFLPSNVC